MVQILKHSKRVRLLIISCILSFFVIGIMPACFNFNPLSPDNGNNSPSIAFSVKYVNYAWGYYHISTFIDNGGKIYRFENYNQGADADSVISLYEEDGCFSEAELEKIYTLLKPSDTVIERDVLIHMRGLLATINPTNISSKSWLGADQGIYSYNGYIFNNINHIYSPIFLSTEGDCRQKNLSPASDPIVTWLKAIYHFH